MKKFSFITKGLVALTLLLGVGLLLLTCDKPFEPVEPEDYPFFISGRNPTQIYTFHPISKKLDSIAVPWNAALTASAKGDLIYVALGSSVLVIDTDSFSTVTELFYDHSSPVAVSPDNRYIAILGLDLYVLRTSDYGLVFSDTTQLLYDAGSFSTDGRFFYCVSLISQDSGYVVYKVDLSDSLFPVTRRGFADGSVHQVVPAIDDSKLFLYLGVGLWTSAFEVLDDLADSVVFRDILVPGAGHFAVSPNGKYVFYTNAARSASDPPSDLSFKVFDIEANQVSAIVSDTNYFCVSTSYGRECVEPNYVAVTPDSRWLGILGGDAFMLPVFYLYDIERGKVVHREIQPQLDHRFINISVPRMKKSH